MSSSDPRRSRTVLAVLVFVSLLLVTVDFRQGDSGPIAGVQNAVMAVFSPLQTGFGVVTSPLTGFFTAVGQLNTLREQNAALVEENERLRDVRADVDDVLRENDELRGAIGMRDRLDLDTVSGNVLAQVGPFRWTVLIDVGVDDGVRRNMAVVNADGFVGRVVDVTGSYSRVQLVASPNAGYWVRVASSGQAGLLSGRGQQGLELQIVDDPDEPVADDVEVVTRAYSGTAIPDGLPVGRTVVDADEPFRAGEQLVQIEPHVDFGDLGPLMVVLNQPVVPEDAPELDEELEDPIDDPEDAATAEPEEGP